ncbi:MAG TPA: hypothetical protein VJN63_05625 [Thermoplasmata archaeon]|nr:hypothetical protein [Thermoplasmata archaeon]
MMQYAETAKVLFLAIAKAESNDDPLLRWHAREAYRLLGGDGEDIPETDYRCRCGLLVPLAIIVRPHMSEAGDLCGGEEALAKEAAR